MDEITLRALSHRDGRKGAHVRAWFVEASNVGRHGWALVQAISNEPTTHGAPAIADGILKAFADLGFIERGVRETWFASEIRAFGVGGEQGHALERAEYPCLFYWTPTSRLRRLIRWIRDHGDLDFTAQIYAFAKDHPDA